MGTIKSAVQLYDGMTPALRAMTRSMNICLNTMESMQAASERPIDTAAIQSARDELAKVEAGYDGIQDAIEKAKNQSDSLGSSTDSFIGKAKKLAGVFAGFAGLRGAVSWVKESLSMSDTQTNVETQLKAVLSNMGAVEGSFEKLKSTASGIQLNGMYGDEAMLGGAAEFATYMSDPAAIQSMMGALADYAAGMSGGGEVDTQAMIDYATQLGKVLNGTYDGIAKKGFTVTDAQKKIIESGTDMEKAAVVAEIIDESWAGLYETMSDTPQGQIIALQNRWGDIREEIGGRLYPVVSEVFTLISEHLTEIGGLVSGVASIIGAGVGFAAGILGFFADHIWLATAAVGAAIIISRGYHAATAAVTRAKVTETAAETAATGVKNRSTIATIVATAQKWKQTAAENSGIIATVRATVANKAHAIAEGARTLATNAGTIAQWAFNAALNACPLIMVITLILTLIGALSGLTGAFGDANEAMMGADGTTIEQEYMARYTPDISALEDLQPYDIEGMETITDNVTTITDNTTNHEVSINDDDVEVMRDIAERQAINRFTTAEIKVEMTNNNQLNSDADIDGIVEQLENKVYESMQSAAEGVHS